jgi:hypothetical protein
MLYRLKLYTEYLCSSRLSYAIYQKATQAVIQILINYLQQPGKRTEILSLFECFLQCYFVRQRTFL